MQTGSLLDEAYVATGKVVNVFRNYSQSAKSVAAAKAAYCAGQQDPRLFWKLHDWLFATQSAWASASDATTQFRQQALEFGADGSRYDACLSDANTDAAIQRDLQDGSTRGVSGTPTFFIERVDAQGVVQSTKPLEGAKPYTEFAQVIDQMLGGQ